MNNKEYKCLDCGKIKLVDVDKNNYQTYTTKYPRCHKCGAKFAEDKLKQTWFKKGFTPWNKDSVGVMKAWNKGIKGTHFSPATEFTSERMSDEKHPFWKGDNVGYFALHSWIQRKKGRAKKCERCDSTDWVQWANKSFEYKRDLNDWLELCAKCHRKYDGKYGWGKATKKFNLNNI